MLRLIRPKFIRRFTHTHSKTIFPENNIKVMEDLIRQQNEILKEIDKTLNGLCICLTLIVFTIAWKPMR